MTNDKTRALEERAHRLPGPFSQRVGSDASWLGVRDLGAVTRSEGANNAAKLVRACGGCLGARRLKGVEDCDKPGGAVKRALIPGYPSKPRELKHLSTWRKRKKPRLRQ